LKYTYSITRDDDILTIKESGELEKGKVFLLCEETYDSSKIESAVSKGKEFLIPVLRTVNIYPPRIFTDKIAETVIDMFGPEGSQSAEIQLNDLDFIEKHKGKSKTIDKTEADLDELIDDDNEDIDDDTDELGDPPSSAKSLDNDSPDIEE
jgi:hypothetical protein